MNWNAVRAEFPSLDRWTYLNTATYGLMPARSRAAVDRHFARRDELACQDYLSWFDDMDCIRQSVARLIHCSAEDVGFVPNASSALSLLNSGVDWRPGDQLLTLADEFPNHSYFGAQLAQRGVEMVVSEPERLLESITPRTRAVALSTVNYANGYRAPVEEIAHAIRGRDTLFYVDGTQSIGALTFDVAKVAPCIFAVDAYKWLLSPNGAGFVYVSPEIRPRLPANVVGWRSDRNWRSVDALNHGAPEPLETAEKYEGGMLPFPSLYAMGETIAMMLEIGPDQLERRVLDLAARVRLIVERLGAEVAHTDSQIVAALFPGVDAPELAGKLKEERVIVAARHGRLRISAQFYNNEEDLEKLTLALKRAL